jgi:hypothetical protein
MVRREAMVKVIDGGRAEEFANARAALTACVEAGRLVAWTAVETDDGTKYRVETASNGLMFFFPAQAIQFAESLGVVG